MNIRPFRPHCKLHLHVGLAGPIQSFKGARARPSAGGPGHVARRAQRATRGRGGLDPTAIRLPRSAGPIGQKANTLVAPHTTPRRQSLLLLPTGICPVPALRIGSGNRGGRPAVSGAAEAGEDDRPSASQPLADRHGRAAPRKAGGARSAGRAAGAFSASAICGRVSPCMEVPFRSLVECGGSSSSSGLTTRAGRESRVAAAVVQTVHRGSSAWDGPVVR